VSAEVEPDPSEAPSGASPVPEEEVELTILPDGRVQVYARCRVGEAPEACAARVRAFVEALGVPEEGVVQKIEERE